MKAIFRYWQVADVYNKYTNSEDNSVQGAEGIQSVLAGKTVYSFGDSLLAGHHSKLGMIHGLTAEYGMIYKRYANNGATINLAGASIYAQVEGASELCPDFIVFDGLTNDVSNTGLKYPVGTVSNGFDVELDTTTFCGSFEATVKLMKEKYPNATIIFVTPHKMPTRDIESFKSLVDTAKVICEKWGITVADIYYEGDIDTTVDEMRLAYSYNNVEGDVGNGTHLTGNGYNIFYAPMIARIMAESIADLGASLEALNGKTVYSFGDSLLYGHYGAGGMIDGLTVDNGMIYTKYARGGNTITINGGKSNVYCQVEAASDVCPDFVVFNGLTNDCDTAGFKNCTLGTITEGFDGPFDKTTFCGSFEATLQLMKQKYPAATIIFVTPHKMPTRHLEVFKTLVDTALEICKKWDITVADVYYAGTIDTTVDAQRMEYSTNDGINGNGNGTHLTDTGYNIFYAPIISRVMAKELADESAEK